MAVLRSFSLALVLSVTHLSLASPHIRSQDHIRRFERRQSIPTTLPGSWTSLGCYTDGNPGGRTLTSSSYTSTTAMTIEACISFCDNAGYIYAGLEYSQECYCGDAFSNGGATSTSTDCNMACSGDNAELCGAGNRLNVFWSGVTPPPGPSLKESVGDWVSLGCYTDNTNNDGRTLENGMGLSVPNTIEACTTACFNAGYPYAGTEYSGECYCDASITHGGHSADASDCSMTCAGDTTEFCGGPNRLNLYHYTGTQLPTNGGGGGGGGPPTGVSPVTAGLPTTWHYAACYVDNAHGRIFEVEQGDTTTLTVENCIATCDAAGYTLAGLEFASQCFCGNRLVNGGVPGLEATCNMGCSGASTEACGGPNRLSVYSSTGDITALPIPVAKTTDLPGNWEYAGCYTDTNTRVLKWQTIAPTNNSVDNCANNCARFGYTAAGMEYGQECYCGDIADLAANGAIQVDESRCQIQCPGDPIHLCGGGLTMSLYTWNGDVNVWHTPTNKGYYEFFVPGVVVPLIATVGINNKVTFLEKAGTGFPNSTGAYELDMSLIDDWETAWRPMHLKTDVFCSGSIILPDKAGRQINVGGWSGDSNFGVRLYTPDGAPGIDSVNDWEEDHTILSLQRARWYPTAALLPNGTILIVGGEIGSNDRAQPNLEILPKPEGGDTVIELDWLVRTDPYNLYPFIMVLPGGGIFVAYYNEARILDPVTFDTVQTLPNMPGSVNNFDAGRTYPLEGAAMIFPQNAPYTDPLRIIVCGGSTPGPAQVLDNCVHIAPEDTNPQWTIERMASAPPSRRVMPCMAPLPDGTFLIVNGAQEGVAGFGLASDPNLNAVLYDPTLPIGQRFSILGNTIVPRLYHSEATLLPDGRVMISGSDPQTPGFDEEFRIEVYVPPYLTAGNTAPTYGPIAISDWSYGGSYDITNVVLHQGSTANMKVSLIAATSSTHGNAMGSRTIFPAFSCNGATCTIEAPPNANVSPPGWHMLFIVDGGTPSNSQWVRIGGDPSELGNWPDLPGFTHPGM